MPRKILVVDDDKMNRELLCRILSGDYEVLQAHHGRDALVQLRALPDEVAAVLLDLVMPQMDGFEVLKAMKNDADLSVIPVIVITGSIDVRTEIQALSLGAQDFLTKPYNPEVIRRRLQNTIGLRETMEQLRFLNNTAHDLLTRTENDDSIDSVLLKTLEYFDGNRAYIFEFDYERGIAVNTYEVCADSISRQKDNLQNVPFSVMSRWIHAFEQKRFISITDVDSLNETQTEERQVLKDQGIRSLVAVPLCRGGKLAGFIGVDDPCRHQSHIKQLEALGDYVSSLLVRRDLNAKIENDAQNLLNLMKDTPGGFVRMQQLKNGAIVPVYVNEGFGKLVCMTPDEVMQKYGHDAFWGVHPDDLAALREVVDTLMREGEIRGFKYRLRHGKGDYVWVVIFGRMTKNESGEIFLNVYYAELSEQEKKELSYREMLPIALAAMLDSSTDFIFVKDKSYKYVFCSRSFAQMAGLKNEREIIGKDDYDLFDAEHADKFRADDRKLMACGQSIIDYVEPLPNHSGGSRYVSTSKYVLLDSFGDVIGLYGLARDITEYREAHTRLKLLTESIPGGLATYALSPRDIRIIYFNDGFCKVIGCSREEYEKLSRHSSFSMVYEEDLPILRRQAERMMRDNSPMDCVYRIRNKDGRRRWVNLRGAPSERHGDTVIANAVLYDVTRQKEAEERLRLNEKEIKLALAQMGKTILLYDLPGHTLTMPEFYAKKHGFPIELSNFPESAIQLGLINVQDVDEFKDFCGAVSRGENHCTARFRVACPDGTWTWERAEAAVISNSDGEALRAIISVEMLGDNISAEANEILTQLYEHFDAMYILDAEQDQAIALKSSKELSEIMPEQKIPWSAIQERIVTELICPEYRDEMRNILFRDSVRSSFSALTDHKERVYLQKANRWKKIVVQPLLIRNGVTARALAVITDITETKRQIDVIAAENAVIARRADEYAGLFFDAASEMYSGVLKVNLDTGDVSRLSFKNGFPEEELLREKWAEYFKVLLQRIHPDDRAVTAEKALHGKLENIHAGESISFTCRSNIIGGVYRWYTITFHTSSKRSSAFGVTSARTVTVFMVDINDEMTERAQLKDLSEHDGLTDLFNRLKYESMRETEYRALESCGVLFFDVNGLKETNDTKGHEAGNELLCQVANSIRSITNRYVHGYRYGGDEFVVVACNVPKKDFDHLLTMWANRLKVLARDSGIHNSVAVGSAWSKAPFSLDELLHVADQNMYRNKLEMKQTAPR